jgi:hypothetical protein
MPEARGELRLEPERLREERKAPDLLGNAVGATAGRHANGTPTVRRRLTTA